MTPIFNSLGSNFVSLSQAVQPLVLSGDPAAHKAMESYLAQKYQGTVQLLYKGREALELALQLAALPPGSAVAINGFTCYAVYRAVVNQGLEVVYLDTELDTLDFSAQSLAQALQRHPNIRAVIIQNTLGFPADVPGIQKICAAHQVILIEDLAHSLGTIYSDGQEAGTVGDFTVLSFSQDKVIDAVSGGALIVRNSTFQPGLQKITPREVPWTTQLRDRWYPLWTWLIRNTYSYRAGGALHWLLNRLGGLSKPMSDLGQGYHQLPEWQCSLAWPQLQALPTVVEHRQRLAKIYLQNLPAAVLLSTFSREQITRSTCLRFPFKVADRQKLLKTFKQHGFYLADFWYDAPIGPAKYLPLTNYAGQCPHSERLTQGMMNLPTHLSVTETQARQLVQLIATCQP